MGWIGLLDKLMGVLPIQKRKERWKNELDNLAIERNIQKNINKGAINYRKKREI